MAERAKRLTYTKSIPWPELEADLQRRLRAAHAKLESAKTTEEVWKAQGACGVLRELLNLPQTLTELNQED